MSARTSFGQWLKQRRKTLDLTQDDLAGRIGCATVTLRKIEADERRPSRQMAELLALHLDIPAGERAAFIQFARAEVPRTAAPWGMGFEPPNNLTAQPTVLIGRDEAAGDIHRRLLRSESRLLTLTGPPGIGKTRLALKAAAEALHEFSDGVYMIALASITDVDLVATTIATVLGVPDTGPRTPLERLKAFLREKEMLLVLDNFEQILPAATQVAELLAVCPSVRILVTSRAPLHIRPERLYPVPPLALAEAGQIHDMETLTASSAVRLFVERAQAVKPDFALTGENAASIAAICARLDGLPLAIELISARVRLLPPAALLERLSGRLMLQSDGSRDLEPRHRTLNAAIEWSYQLLSDDEQTLFRRAGVFVGGWTLEAAEAICAENLSLNLLDGLASLLDKNLIFLDSRVKRQPRYLMLETIREYAREQLAASGDMADMQKRHADYFTRLAEQTEAELGRVNQALWMNILEAEHDNLRAALASGETGLRLGVALRLFWLRHGHLNEGSRWLQTILARQAPALTKDDQRLSASALQWQATFRAYQDDLDAAQPLYEESLELFRQVGERTATAEVLDEIGMLYQMRGDLDRAGKFLEESMALHSAEGDEIDIAYGLFFLGTLVYSRGQTEDARVHWEACLTAMRAENDTWSIADVLAYLAMVAVDQGEYDRARAYLTESLSLLWDMGERWQIIHTLEVFACLAAVEGGARGEQMKLPRAARIFGAAEMLRETLHIPLWFEQQQFYERGVTALRAQLDEGLLAAAWAEGRSMTLEQAVAYALEATE